jgi:hypothetical protein
VSVESGQAHLPGMYIECYFMYMSLRHKHLKIDQRKLDRAKRLLKLKTEQATIDRALDAVLADEVIIRTHRRLRGVGGVVAAFEDE